MYRRILSFLWLVLVWNFSGQAQITLVNPALEGGFELGPTFALNGWTVVNGSQTNQWHLGNPTGLGATGLRAAFISNTLGSTHNYSTTATSVVHFYRDITIPAGVSINLSFSWRGQGEGCCDYLRVFVVPTTTTPTAGTQLTSGQVGGNFNLQGAWQTTNLTGVACNTTATPITRRLVFSWRNDFSAGMQPPAAVDNISVTTAPLPACNLGTGVTNVVSLPYNSGPGTTCGAVNDLTSSNTVTCGSSSYLGGEDRVWVFTAPSTGSISINLTSTGTWTGLMVYEGCPLNCGTCIANAQSSSGNKSLCFNATAGTTYYVVLDSWPLPACNAYTNLSISAPFSSPPLPCTLSGSYTISTITHNPDVLTSANLSGFTDDIFYPGGTIATGFDFCLNGNQYQSFLISANAYVIFDPPFWTCGGVTNLPSDNATAGGYSGWQITANIPNTTNAPRNAILAPWHDIDPGYTTGASPIVRYQVFGTAPNRRFVVSWENVPMYSNPRSSCSADRALDFTAQIKMFETTNNIEIHITHKRVCASWNNGRAILGLHNYNGTEALVPAGRNALDPNWTATNEAYRFTFNPTTCTTCTPLPLNLMFFTGEWNKETLEAELQWSFKDQKDAILYVLEHSTDEVNFKEIAQIPVKNENIYRFNHKNPAKGRNYYRIRKVSNGRVDEYSHNVTVINPITEAWKIESLYPNPSTTHSSTLEILNLIEDNCSIKLMDLQGNEVFAKKVLLQKGNNTIEINYPKHLQAGTYMLLIQTSQQIETRKVILQ